MQILTNLFFYCIILFLMGSIALSDSNEVLIKIKEKVDYKNDEFLFLNFMNLGDCSKCLNLSYSAYNCVLEKLKETNLPFLSRFLVVVRCNREGEINRFRKIYNWDGLCFFDPGDVKEKLKLPPDTWLAIFKNDTCLANFSIKKKVACDTLYNVLKKFVSSN